MVPSRLGGEGDDRRVGNVDLSPVCQLRQTHQVFSLRLVSPVALTKSLKTPKSVGFIKCIRRLCREQIKPRMRTEIVTCIKQCNTDALPPVLRINQELRDIGCNLSIGQGAHKPDHPCPICRNKRGPRMAPGYQRFIRPLLRRGPALGAGELPDS